MWLAICYLMAHDSPVRDLGRLQCTHTLLDMAKDPCGLHFQIIHFWTDVQDVNNAAWIVPLLVLLVVIQYFGVRGYGEVEFALSLLKIIACTGFGMF